MPSPDEQPLDLTLQENQNCGNCWHNRRSNVLGQFLCEEYMEPGLQQQTYKNRAGASFIPCIITHPENWCTNWTQE